MTRTLHTGTSTGSWTGSWTAAGAVLLMVLTGCGGSASGADSATAAGDVAAAESTAASAAADPGDDDNGSGDAALFSDAEACAWLKKTMPEITKAQNDLNAQLVLTLGLSKFFEDHGGLEHADGYAFDDATARACKTEHDAAIKKAKIKSFGNL